MTTDFFVRLTLATHKVAGILPKQDPLGTQLKDAANKLLAGLVLLLEDNPVTPEQKQSIAPRAIRELGILVAYLNYARRTAKVNPENFLVLEREYAKVGDFVRSFHEALAAQARGAVQPVQVRHAQQQPKPGLGGKDAGSGLGEDSLRPSPVRGREALSGRQTRILELMRNKDKVQIWELQKVLPQVTKRTLRRDMDDLLKRNLVLRQGEWNEVFYTVVT